MIRVLVADDHTMIREMLRLALSRTSDVKVVGEAADGRELVEMAERLRPDVLLVDYEMPHSRDFTGLVRRLRESLPRSEAIVLSGTASCEIAEKAARGGARGYVVKSTRLGAVSDAIRTVAAGGSWVDPNLPRAVFDAFCATAGCAPGEGEAPSNPGLTSLTRREREVLAGVADGGTNREIGRKLGVSEATIKAHLGRILSKLGVKSRLAAALVFHGRSVSTARAPQAGTPRRAKRSRSLGTARRDPH